MAAAERIARTAMLEIAFGKLPANGVCMLILDYKLRVHKNQQGAIDEAIRTVQFVRNKCIRLWMDTRGTNDAALQHYCAELAQAFPFAARLNSMARQAAADRAWFSIARFYQHCREKKPGKKGTPASRKITGRLSTRRAAGSWSRTASMSLSPMAWASVGAR